jgi:DNA polymerase III epsilon subunit family exonuclease
LSQPSKAVDEGTSDKGPMRERPYLFLDLETTGLNPGYQEICEIGALLVSQSDLKVIKTFDRKVKPEHIETASPEALKICGYTPEKWVDAISLKEGLTELSELAHGAVLMGFNVTFDWAYLQAGFNQVGLPDPFYYHRVDVMSAVFAKYYNNQKFNKFSLRECCQYFGITNRHAHTALADAEATYEVYAAMMRDTGA